MGSRLLYGMSRQGLLPVLLGKVHSKRQTPHVAILVLFVIVSALILAGGVKQLAEATVLLLLTVFTIVNLALVRLKLRKDEINGQFEVPVWVPVLGALVCALLIIVRLGAAITSTNSASRTAPLVAGAIVLVALGLYAVLRPAESTGSEAAT